MNNYDYQFTSHGNHDECYTPPYVVEAIVPYLPYGRTRLLQVRTKALGLDSLKSAVYGQERHL